MTKFITTFVKFKIFYLGHIKIFGQENIYDYLKIKPRLAPFSPKMRVDAFPLNPICSSHTGWFRSPAPPLGPLEFLPLSRAIPLKWGFPKVGSFDLKTFQVFISICTRVTRVMSQNNGVGFLDHSVHFRSEVLISLVSWVLHGYTFKYMPSIPTCDLI